MRQRLFAFTAAVALFVLPGSRVNHAPSSGENAASGASFDVTRLERVYENRLTPITDPRPLLADYPEFVEPIRNKTRFRSPVLVEDAKADLWVRAWRFSYNARGIIEIPNRLDAKNTAVIVVHPWGIDDAWGFQTPQPAGAAFACTPEKNHVVHEHMTRVVNPLLKSLRGRVGLVGYSLPGIEDPIRRKLYRSIHGHPTPGERSEGAQELCARLKSFPYKGQSLPDRFTLTLNRAAVDYFQAFPGLDAGDRFNHASYWNLPIPIAKAIEVAPRDVVFYDGDGYAALKDFLCRRGIRHVLLAGYHTDMCIRETTAGFKNLRRDFNTFLVGDATQATFPACDTPRFATTAAVSFAALDVFVTQVSWIKVISAQ